MTPEEKVMARLGKSGASLDTLADICGMTLYDMEKFLGNLQLENKIFFSGFFNDWNITKEINPKLGTAISSLSLHDEIKLLREEIKLMREEIVTLRVGTK